MPLYRPFWSFSVPHPCRAPDRQPQRFRGRHGFQGVFVRVHALRELDAIAGDPFLRELLFQFFRSAVARLVPVVRDQNPFGSISREGLQVIRRESLHPIRRRHVAVTRAPERKRVDQRLTQDDFPGIAQRFDVPDALVCSGKVEVERGSFAEIGKDLAAIDLRDVPGLVRHRNHEAS